MAKNKARQVGRRAPVTEAALTILDAAEDRVQEWIGTLNTGVSFPSFAYALLRQLDIRLDLYQKMGVADLHERARLDIFSCSWALRMMRRSSAVSTVTAQQVRVDAARLSVETVASFFDYGALYHHWRDNVFCARQGGYDVATVDDVLHFTNPAGWPGIRDAADHDVVHAIELMHVLSAPKPAHPREHRDPLEANDEFPRGLATETITSDEFAAIWREFRRLLMPQGPDLTKAHEGGPASTSRLELIQMLATEAEVRREAATAFVSWHVFSDETPLKFSLLHAPLVDVGGETLLIARAPLVMAKSAPIARRHFAHADRKAYDAWSSQHEQAQLAVLSSHLSRPDVRVQLNRDLPDGDGEVDVAWYEERTRTLVIAQAKFFIGSDSPAEVEHANIEIDRALQQTSACRRYLDERGGGWLAKHIFGVDLDVQSVAWLVIPTNTIGADYLEIPEDVDIVPVGWFLIPGHAHREVSQLLCEFRALLSKALAHVDEGRRIVAIENVLGGLRWVLPGMRTGDEEPVHDA